MNTTTAVRTLAQNTTTIYNGAVRTGFDTEVAALTTITAPALVKACEILAATTARFVVVREGRSVYRVTRDAAGLPVWRYYRAARMEYPVARISVNH